MTYKRPTDYWCNDDEQVKIIEAALDHYEATVDRPMSAHTLAREEIETLCSELAADADEETAIQARVLGEMALECMEARMKGLRPEAALMTWRKCRDDDHAERKGVHLLKGEATRGSEISITALWQGDFYECIAKVPPLTAEVIDGACGPQKQ